MKDLCSDEEIVKIITGDENAPVPNYSLPYSQVFPYEFIPDTVGEGRTFVCFDTDIVSVPNKTFYVPVLYIWPFTHKSLLRADGGGCLLDNLAIAINKVLNRSRCYGLGELKLDSVRRFVPIDDYLGRILTYYAKDFNSPSRPKPTPATRKVGR